MQRSPYGERAHRGDRKRVAFTQEAKDLPAEQFESDPSIVERLSSNSLLLPQHAEQEVLGPHVRVIVIPSLAHRELENLLGSRGIREVLTLGLILSLLDCFVDRRRHVPEIHIQIGQCGGCHTFALAQDGQEDVLGADVLVLQSRGLFARHLQHLADTIGKVVAVHRVRWLGSVTTNASGSGRISIPLKSAIVASTPDRSPGRCVVVSPIARAPAARAATMPAGASSNTRHAAGSTPRHFAPRRYPSGAGLPYFTSSATISTSGTGSPADPRRCRASSSPHDVTTAQRSDGSTDRNWGDPGTAGSSSRSASSAASSQSTSASVARLGTTMRNVSRARRPCATCSKGIGSI